MTPKPRPRAQEVIAYIREALTPEVVVSYLEKLKRDHGRGVRLRALRERKRWRKADVAHLLDIGGLTLTGGGLKPAAQRRMARLRKDKSPGRGVLDPPRSFDDARANVVTVWKELADPATPPEAWRERLKKTPWWRAFIEAAYRGELEKVKASKVAKHNVAKAAGITVAQVHRLCVQVRAELRSAPPDEPAMSAADLARLLEMRLLEESPVVR